MTWIQFTKGFIVTVTIIVILYDVLARVCGGDEATLSYQIHDAVCRNPIIAGAIGLLVGHLLWPVK